MLCWWTTKYFEWKYSPSFHNKVAQDSVFQILILDLNLFFPSTECRNGKTKVVTLANHKGNTVHQSELEVITRSWREARENVYEKRVTFYFWLDKRKVARVF